MRLFYRTLLVTALLCLPAPSLRAQTAVDPSGHWEGTIQAPNMEVKIEVDLTKNSKGELAGTFGNLAQKVTGLPLASVAVDGRSVSFQIKGTPGERTFKGALSADGTSMSGDYTQGGHAVPFSMTRTGEARIEPPVKNAPIGTELEGTWNGTLDVKGTQRRLALTMSNQPDGTATGSLVNIDEGLEIPATTITQKASSVTVDFKSLGSYTGALNAEGTELVGAWTQGPAVLPLIFRLVKP